MPLGMEVGLAPGEFVFNGYPVTPRKKGTLTPPNFWPVSIVAKRWMDEDVTLGTEVDIDTGHIVLDVVPAVRERRTAAPPPLFAHVYCGHGRPPQLLLSSCTHLCRLGSCWGN